MKQLKFSCPDDLRSEISSEAAREDSSESALIRRAVRQYIARKRAARSRATAAARRAS